MKLPNEIKFQEVFVILNFEHALQVQSRRHDAGKPFVAKAVKRFLKRQDITPDEWQKLGRVVMTPPGFKRSPLLDGETPSEAI